MTKWISNQIRNSFYSWTKSKVSTVSKCLIHKFWRCVKRIVKESAWTFSNSFPTNIPAIFIGEYHLADSNWKQYLLCYWWYIFRSKQGCYWVWASNCTKIHLFFLRNIGDLKTYSLDSIKDWAEAPTIRKVIEEGVTEIFIL